MVNIKFDFFWPSTQPVKMSHNKHPGNRRRWTNTDITLSFCLYLVSDQSATPFNIFRPK